MKSLLAPFSSLGRAVLRGLRRLGQVALFLVAACVAIFQPPLQLRRTLAQIHFIGLRSGLVIVATALFTGMVLALQGYYTVRRFGAGGLLGAAVALGLIRELGPVLTGLMITARAGSSMAAEIGIMRISEQIDALEVMALSPMRYLVAPRLLATLVSGLLLTAIFDVVGILGGYLVAVWLLGSDPGTFFASMRHAVELSDVRGGIYKSLSFGVIIAWICTEKGYHTRHGAEGVGRATTEAVVTSAVFILVWDYFLTSVLFPS